MPDSIYLLLFVFLGSTGIPCIAQEEVPLKELSEQLAASGQEDPEGTEVAVQLDDLRKHPINLNSTNPQALASLIWLSPLQISNFFNYLHTHGKLLDLAELQSIPAFDDTTIERILPFVTISSQNNFSLKNLANLYRQGNHDLIFRYGRLLQQQKGFNMLPGSRYLGSPDKFLIRYRYTFPEVLSAALVMKKDAGEMLFNGKIMIDHIGGHLALYRIRKIEQLVIGDYSLQFGQGLTLWSGFAFGKGPDVTSVAAKETGIRPYTSANETSFLRGLATSIQLSPRVRVHAFASFRKLDASLKYKEDKYTWSAISTSGLHRTATELKNRKSLGQTIYGTVWQYQYNSLGLGLILYHSTYEHEHVSGNVPYRAFAFNGRSLLNTGFHYQYTFRNVYYYGEIAHSPGGGTAFLNGLMASISKKLAAVLVYRNYARNYHNFLSRALGENTETSNEQGWYLGLNYQLTKHWKASAYIDKFKFPWLKYRVNAPSAGWEALGQLDYIPSKTFSIHARIKTSRRQQNPNAADADSSGMLQPLHKTNYRLDCNLTLNSRFRTQQRFEIINYTKGNHNHETGYLLYQDLIYHPRSSAISGNIRLAWFHTPSYQSRIYAYENDVLYGASSGNYYGKGIRGYLNLRYRLARHLDLWARYAIYIYRNQDRIGSGLDEIQGNQKSDFKLQIRWQF